MSTSSLDYQQSHKRHQTCYQPSDPKRRKTMPVLNNDATMVPTSSSSSSVEDHKRPQWRSTELLNTNFITHLKPSGSVGSVKRRKSNDKGDDDVHIPRQSAASQTSVGPLQSVKQCPNVDVVQPKEEGQEVSSESKDDDSKRGKSNNNNNHKALSTITGIPREDVVLPDPKEGNVNPDEFLCKIVKAQSGLSVKVHAARSLDNFFMEVSEEQRAAYTMKVVDAVRKNDLPALQLLEEQDGQRVDCFNRFGESLLHMACRRGFEDIVKYLLEHPGINVRIVDDNGRTPLHDACWHPSPQLTICKWILERDPTLFLLTDNRGYTPFQYARPQHWLIWRTFLLENRHHLEGLSEAADILSSLQ